MASSSAALVPVPAASTWLDARPVPALPWRDPHTVSSADLAAYIGELEHACLARPESADLRTCLGMAYAMNYDVYKSMDMLDSARTIDPENFWAQMKFSELQYRLRALSRAEGETVKALELARNPIELSIARKQLLEIRRLRRESARDVTWDKPLITPALVLSAMVLLTFVVMWWR